mgnify:CR=1 FL=1
MAGILKVDDLRGNTSAGDITITDGSATSSLQSGLVKAWGNFTSEGTFTTNDSFNTSSITDTGTGSAQPNWSNNFSSANYAATMSCEDSSAYHGMMQQISNPTTALTNILSASATNTARDVEYGYYMTSGDLA